MAEVDPSILHRLLAEAVPFKAFLTARAASRPKPSPNAPPSQGGQSAPAGSSAIQEGVALTHFLIEKGALNLGPFDDWFRHMTAWKNTYGEEGYAAWIAICAEAEGFKSEEDCRKHWEKFTPRSDGPRLTIATYVMEAQKLGWKSSRGRKSETGSKPDGESAPDDGDPEDPGDGKHGSGRGNRTDQAVLVLDQADDAGDEHWCDQDGQAYATFTLEAAGTTPRKVHVPIDSGSYRGVLQHRFLEDAVTKVLSSEQENRAVSLLSHRARNSGERHPVHLRSAMVDDAIYIDLGRPDGKVLHVRADGHALTDDPPVRFVSGSRSVLPLPELGGMLADFQRHFNVSPSDLKRIVGFCIGTFRGAGPYPILLVEGASGRGKSGIGDGVVALTDPPTRRNGARFSLATEERNLHVHALHAHVLFFDNLSTVNPKEADAICRISTGGASSFRTHHTMSEETQMSITRPIVATCISTPSDRNDLLSRCLRVTALPVEEYRSEEELWESFGADAPKMFGFIVRALSTALRNRAAVAEARRGGELRAPRLADFALFVEGAAAELELPPGGFCALLNEEQASIQAEAILSDPVAEALTLHFSRNGLAEVDVTARELLALLDKTRPHEEWPGIGQLRGRLDKIAPGLKAAGIEVSTRKDAHTKVWRMRIRTTADFQPVVVPAPAPPAKDRFSATLRVLRVLRVLNKRSKRKMIKAIVARSSLVRVWCGCPLLSTPAVLAAVYRRLRVLRVLRVYPFEQRGEARGRCGTAVARHGSRPGRHCCGRHTRTARKPRSGNVAAARPFRRHALGKPSSHPAASGDPDLEASGARDDDFPAPSASFSGREQGGAKPRRRAAKCKATFARCRSPARLQAGTCNQQEASQHCTAGSASPLICECTRSGSVYLTSTRLGGVAAMAALVHPRRP